MPLFMAITGYFCYMGKNISLWYVTKKKLRQLILPGIAFAVAMSLLTGFGSGFHILGLLCPYWFLQCAFICAMLYYTTIFLIPRKYLCGGILCSLLISQAILVNNVFRLYPAFITGVVIHQYWFNICRNSKRIAFVSCLVFLTMLLFLSSDFYGPQDLKSVRGIFITAYHLGYRVLIGSISALGMICSFYLLESRIRDNKIMKSVATLGRYTLSIYIIQTFIIESVLASALNFNNTSPIVFYCMIAPSICIGVILVSVLIARIIEKSAITSYFFLGHEYKPLSNRFI